MSNLFWNITTEGVERDVARYKTHVQTCPATNQVVASCVNTEYGLDKIKRESGETRDLVTYCQTSLPWPVKRTTCTDFVSKSRTSLHLLQQLFATCNNLIVARRV